MAKKNSVTKLQRAAYHEAGHAVASYLVKRRLSYCTIEPNPDNHTLGHCEYRNLATFKPDAVLTGRLRNQIEKLIIVLLAGAVAESLKFSRTYWKGSEDDTTQAHDLAIYLCIEDKEAGAFINWLWQRTRNILEFGPHWAAVEAISEELMKSKYMSERQTRKIIGTTLQRVAP
jgi:hypothetical protein